ncbi:UPF0496 protein At3g49070 [Cornus florida]|uniref:UPF0496 protein At3g49070 n=1 Tax=Cornus florida TaxID=4283 RepID=UPI00289FB73A|nr:UPF0496 protein At3g49070 [Cornus florida]
MKIKINVRIKKLFSCNVTRLDNPNHSTDLDLREEYANAFRTESYNEFWTRVLALSNGDSATCNTMGNTTAARLPSYRLFVEHLLDPDQPTVTRILALTQNHLENHTLLYDYFSATAEASLLCGLLLKNIDHTRVKYRSIRSILESLETVRVSSITHLPKVLTRLTKFSNSFNPIVPTASSPRCFQAVQDTCSELIKRLESSRDKVRAKLRIKKMVKHGLAIFLVALTASLTVVALGHGLAMLVAAPSIMVARLVSTRKLARLSAQLDTAAKGTYILNRDLDMIGRLVARLNDELEHMRATVRFWLKRGEDRFQASGEVARQLKMDDASFRELVDELEEHLYLCFMTINRARNLVMQEILDPGWNLWAPSLISKPLLSPS